MINKSASRIGTLAFPNGNRTVLYVGSNHNTGETIVWQQTTYSSGITGKPSRTTGRNLTKLADELDEALNEGEISWVSPPNYAALDAFAKYRSRS